MLLLIMLLLVVIDNALDDTAAVDVAEDSGTVCVTRCRSFDVGTSTVGFITTMLTWAYAGTEYDEYRSCW